MTGPTDNPAAKADLRKRVQQSLAGLTSVQWRELSLAASARLIDTLELSRAKTVLFYMPTAREVDISTAAQWCLSHAIRVCLPRTGWHDQTLTPALVDRWGENLATTRHGLLEPAETAQSVSLLELDLVVVPGLGFDNAGGRLGKGGGFYDRFLATPELHAAKVGVGLDEQVVESVPRDPWDMPLDVLVTPTRTFVFNAGTGPRV